jgi:hypothetical protein
MQGQAPAQALGLQGFRQGPSNPPRSWETRPAESDQPGALASGATIQSMPRKMVWIERSNFAGWGCSECAWLFNPSDPPTGPSFEEMKQRFESQRDKDFDLHVCAAHAKVQAAKVK